MKNITKKELFEAAIKADEHLDLMIGTDEEEKANAELKEIMNYIEQQGLRKEFDEFAENYDYDYV